MIDVLSIAHRFKYYYFLFVDFDGCGGGCCCCGGGVVEIIITTLGRAFFHTVQKGIAVSNRR